ncbi:MAG: hypothetical protein V2J07_08170 [Anaerolineae bacterium]|jgi:hypothetical protein|nr:hypothetical protein [Anaerolineae bacterium]
MSDIGRKDAFQHAIRTLAHPFSLLSMAVLFFNDYYLRIVRPSWLTGKLGDFAWLFFFPIFLTALLVWVLPRKWLKGTTPILIGIGITAVVFTLGKTVPSFLQVIIDSIEFFMPWQVGWVIDPTDLIALPIMALTLLLWVKLPEPPPMQHLQLQWLWLTGALLLTMGNSAAPPTGIACLEIIDGEVYAGETYGVYRASNGGLHWTAVPPGFDFGTSQIDECNFFRSFEPLQTIIDPSNEQNQFKFSEDNTIKHSTDGGKTWVDEFEIKPKTEAGLAHYSRHHLVSFNEHLPLDAEFDVVTGNLILAMGFEGILVRDFSGNYSWVDLGGYEHIEMTFESILELLYPGDVGIGIFLAAIAVAFFRRKEMTVVELILWGITVTYTLLYGFVVEPAKNSYGYNTIIVFWGLVGGLTLSVALFILTYIKVRPVMPVFLTGCMIPVIYIATMLLWGYNIIPWYQLAFGIGVVLSAGWTVFRHFQYSKLRKKIVEGEVEI